jgi:hypothetical protein
MTLLPQDLRRTLRTALIHSFMAHNFSHEEAMMLAEIALEPCAVTMDICEKIMQTTIEIQERTAKPARDKPEWERERDT